MASLASLLLVMVDSSADPAFDCSGNSAVIKSWAFGSAAVETCQPAASIQLGPDVTVEPGAVLVLQAPYVSIRAASTTGPISIEESARVLIGQFHALSRLNDTGITGCADYSRNDLTCPVSWYPGQDAEHGRDVTHDDDRDGHAGFSFTKLGVDGNALLADAIHWDCVRDNVTGLVWEVKMNDGGLHDRDDLYTWYNTDVVSNGGFAGSGDDWDGCDGYDGNRPASFCNTQAYAARVNAEGLCGARDWRLPSAEELMSIVSNDRSAPAIDAAYFPNTRGGGWFWSSSPSAYDSGYAWDVGFGSGYVGSDAKYGAGSIRLVRGGQ